MLNVQGKKDGICYLNKSTSDIEIWVCTRSDCSAAYLSLVFM